MILIHLLATTPREIITCLHIILLVTNEHTKNISLDFIANILLRNENLEIQWSTFLDLMWPPMMELIKFTYPMQFLVDIRIYMQKIVSLGVVINLWPLVTSSDFLWHLVTSNDHRIQMYIAYIFSSTHVCIHAKNWVSKCYKWCIVKYIGFVSK